MALGDEVVPDAEPGQHSAAGRRNRFADAPAGLALLSTITTSSTPRAASAIAVAQPAVPPPTMTTS